ncbi:hypothetical protein M5D96_005429 [Drosophila gunungcola]|uniref:SCP domain-containing protein n=1 Tax=Drosophila gunungcola TaxID=103775 RepID=A0A9P9YQR4_9MUSC|nr:hypothetical protein M5D96_005429 [Drosophila gunungcola]
MLKMMWDSDLAYLAELLVKRCDLHPTDHCISTELFSAPGYHAVYNKFKKNEDAFRIVRSQLNSWYDQYKHVSAASLLDGSEIGHFLRMMVGPSNRIGCAMARLEKDGWNHQWLGCLYSCSPKKNSLLYEYSINPGMFCTTGVDGEFQHLCNETEPVEDCKSRMLKMMWDTDLAYLAELLVKRCDLQPTDHCISTELFSAPGYHAVYNKFKKNEDAFRIVRSQLNSWYDQYKHVSAASLLDGSEIGHFLRMMVGPSNRIGCAMARLEKDGWNHQWLGCLYSCSPKKNSLLYEYSINPGMFCTTGVDGKFQHLCNETEPVEDCKMAWSSDLARLAELLVKRCDINPTDRCMSTELYSEPGYHAVYNKFKKNVDAFKVVRSQLNAWYDEYKHVSAVSLLDGLSSDKKEIGHFLRMMVGPSNRLGCAMARVEKGGWTHQWLACVYSCSPKKNSTLYEFSTTPGVLCTTGVDGKYQHLCNRTEPVENCKHSPMFNGTVPNNTASLIRAMMKKPVQPRVFWYWWNWLFGCTYTITYPTDTYITEAPTVVPDEYEYICECEEETCEDE